MIEGGSPSCWVKLNMEAMRKEYLAVQSRRVALGESDEAFLSAGFLPQHQLHTVFFSLFFLPLCFPQRDAEEGVTMATKRGLSSGDAHPACADGTCKEQRYIHEFCQSVLVL